MRQTQFEMPFSRVLRVWLAENNIKQKDLAERTGITQVRMHRLRNGKYLPTSEEVVRISQETGISVERLLISRSGSGSQERNRSGRSGQSPLSN